jgi:hypothetical protein
LHREDLIAQLAMRFVQRGAGALLRARQPASEVGDLLACEQHVLDRVVTQRLGEAAALARLAVEGLLHEPAASAESMIAAAPTHVSVIASMAAARDRQIRHRRAVLDRHGRVLRSIEATRPDLAVLDV